MNEFADFSSVKMDENNPNWEQAIKRETELYKKEGDLHLKSEEDLVSLLNEGGYDYIIADSLFKAAATKTSSTWIDVEHFAVSGRRYQS